jgi:FixJ family two-component response regulator
LSGDRQRRAADGNFARIRDCFATLSSREQQVVMGVTAGKMNKQVAGDLGVSEITVKIHRGVAMRKMCARMVDSI